jgi:MFS family permease
MLEGTLHAVMVGVAESYLGAFAVELGHGAERLALLATLPLLAGAACQLLSPMLCAALGGRKRVVIAGALGQTASLGALCVIAGSENTSLGPLLAAQIAFWVSGGAMTPAWNAWMASLTVHTHRPRYFARRSALNHVSLLLSFGVAGWALQQMGTRLLDCFVMLFAVAFAARLSSALALLLQTDVEPMRTVRVSDAMLLPRLDQALRWGRFRVAAYLAMLAFGTQISAPFFTPYMLRELGLDYQGYAALCSLSIFAKAATFPCCHHLAERFGLRQLLRWSGVGVAVIPVFWAVSPRLDVLIVAHAIGGAAWAALEYASFQLLLEDAPPGLGAEFFSLSSALTGVAQVAGALGGAVLLHQPGIGYSQIFLLSSFSRALPLMLLFFGLQGEYFPRQLRELYARILSARPIAPDLRRPILNGTELPRALGSRTTDPPPAL